jgi:hypothetical protein
MELNINGVIVNVETETLQKAIEEKKESFEIKADEVVLRTKEKSESYESNIKSEAQTIGQEIGRKEVFKGLEIDIEGTGAHKTVEKSIEALRTWNTNAVNQGVKGAGIEPDKKVQALTDDLDALKLTLTGVRGDLETSKTNHLNFVKSGGIRQDIAKGLPKNITLNVDDAVDLIMLRKKFDRDEHGKTFEIGADGLAVKDADRNVLAVSNSITSFFDAHPTYLSGAAGGAGGGDSGGSGTKQTVQEFTAEMQKDNVPFNGDKFNQIKQERIKAGTLDV